MRASKYKYAFRHLYRHKLYTFLNLAGLAIGLAVAMVVAMYLYSAFTYDKHHPGYREIYRVNSHFRVTPEKLDRLGTSGYGLSSLMEAHFEEVEAATHLLPIEQNVVFQHNGHSSFKSGVAFADSNFLRVFRTPLVFGNPKQILQEPRTIVLARSFAEEFFGPENPVGQEIRTSNYRYRVSAVIEDWPENSHHRFSALISFPNPKEQEALERSLWSSEVYTFVRIPQPEEAAAVQANFAGFYERYMADFGVAMQSGYQIDLSRIDQLHFNIMPANDRPGGKRAYLYGFAGIGLLILIMACINFINMATARSLKRIREAAMRKVLGATRADIRWLMLTEAFLLCAIALFLAFVIVELLTKVLPFNAAIGKDLSLNFSRFPFLIWFPPLLALLVGAFSGWFPAYRLGKVAPIDAFANKKGLHLKRSAGRKFLVGFQVAVSVAVVILAFNMYHQIDYIRNKNLGFNSNNVLLLNAQDSTSLRNLPSIQAKVAESPFVQSVGLGASITGKRSYRGLFGFEEEEGGGGHFDRRTVDFLFAGTGYLHTMQIGLLEGRDFQTPADSESAAHQLLVNQELVRSMGWTEPLGKRVQIAFQEDGSVKSWGEVVGITANFNANSLHEEIRPLVISYNDKLTTVLHLRLRAGNLYAALDDIERRWISVSPEAPFQFSFLDTNLQRLYDEEIRQSRLILYLTCLAILISFFGFIGLASFTTNLRTREIGIRKVLGASNLQTVHLVFRELLLVIFLAVVAAVPLALVLSMAWLDNFAYRAPLDPSVIIFTTALALFVGYGIVALHSLKISKSQTIDSLHHL